MPTDPASDRSTSPRHGDTDVPAEPRTIPLVMAIELTRLQVQRDQLADLVRVAVAHVVTWSEADEPAGALLAQLDAILRGRA